MKKIGAVLLIVLLLFFGYKTFISPKDNEEASGTTNEVIKNDVEVEKEELDEEGNVIEEEIIGNEEDEEDIFKDEDDNDSSNNDNTGSTGNTGGNTGGTSGNTGNTGGTSGNTGNTGNTGGTSGNTGNTGNIGGNGGNTGTTTPTVEYGTVVINYIDEEGTKIAGSTTDNKAKVGSTYKYNAPAMDGYIIDNSSATVTINTKGEKKEVNFKYANEDHVPYISTYHVEGSVKTGQEVKIKFYITDYNQTEYREGDTSKTFTVTLKADGKQTITKTLKAGTHEISLGSFATETTIDYSIKATDKYGRNSHEVFHYFRVHNGTAKKEYVMTQADLQKYNIKNTDPYPIRRYVDVEEISDNIKPTMEEAYNNASVPSNSYVVLIPRNINDNNTKGYKLYPYVKVKYASDYNATKVAEDSKNTREGLQKFLDDVKAQGYNYVKLLNGIYRIDHEAPISLPTEFTLDLNGATIKLNQFTGDSSVMMEISDCYDSHLINGIIEGDYYEHDYANSTNNSEWVSGISLNGISEYSSFENLEVRDITGYGVMNGMSSSRSYTYFYPIAILNWEYGEINKTTGEVEKAENRAVSDFIDLKTSNESGYRYIAVSKYLGYQGRIGNTWNMHISFYDKDKKYISSIDAYQYKRLKKPEGSAYLRVTVYEAKGVSLDTFKELRLTIFKSPTNSVVRNILINNARCVGMAPGHMHNMLFEDIEFTRNGQSGAYSAMDAEDGWDGMQDVTFRRLNFHDNHRNDFLTCSGHNFIVEDMIAGNLHVYGRTNSFVYENNTKNTKAQLTIFAADRARNGYYRVQNNNLMSARLKTDGEQYQTKNWPQIVKNTTFTRQTSGEVTFEESTFKFKYFAGKFYDCIFDADPTVTSTREVNLGGGYYERCTINGARGENTGGYYKNCVIKDVSGNLHNTMEIHDSTVTNFQVGIGTYDPHLYIDNSNLTNVKLNGGYWGVGHFAEIKNSTITLSDSLYRLPHYSLKWPIALKNNNITITNNSSVIEFYDDRDNSQATYERKGITITGNTVKSTGGTQYLIKGLKGTTNTNNPMTFEIKNNQLNGIAIFEDGVVNNNKFTIK